MTRTRLGRITWFRWSACLAVTLGCGTPTLSAKGRDVAPLEGEPGPRCSPLGTITGTADPFFGATKSDDELVAAARNDALEAAARLGATHVRFTGEPSRSASQVFGGGTAFVVTALAYRCTPAEPSGPAQGCSKDTDCKGERICDSGRCVDAASAR